MKRGFTLIEVLLAIAILSLLFLAMSSVLANIKMSTTIFAKKYQKDKDYLVKVLYYDLLNSKSIKILKTVNPDIDRLIIKTSNSLYKLINPTVIWYISKHKNSLIRIEGFKSFPFESEFIDKFDENVEIFKIYNKKNRYFIYIKGKKKVAFEIFI
ncbi:MAG TPA: prepilin-type N-terminal cleavage/methylation domain-containing protein [Campylobacterales bacterium]|nr:prepilin-type N-terminal cleavage/methylation domain-containing protein [Campylobacterales bacterium]